MEQAIYKYLMRFLLWSGAFLCIAVPIVGMLFSNELSTFILAYLLSLAFVGSNFWTMRKIKIRAHSQFIRRFYGALAGRFILVLTVFILFFIFGDGHQIFFVLSFIFSYICQSIFEIVFLKKIMEFNNQG
jgi:hypothetical protein